MATSLSPQASASALAALESSIRAAGAPYEPINHALGSPPTPIPDIPLSAVFLVIFLICAIINIRLLRGNLKKGHKFVFSGAMFGFCNIRVISAALRIAWSKNPKNVRLGIAANIFIFAGVFILYVINIFFTQRIIRSHHPHIGWTRPIYFLVPMAIVLAVGSLIMVIVATIQSFYTLDTGIRRVDHDITLFVSTAFAVLAFFPTPMLLIHSMIPRRTPQADNFGTGRLSTKYMLVIFTSIILTLGIAFRDGIQFLTPVNILNPSPWYFDKGCFYGFGFVTDAIVIITYLVFRVDMRFYVPNGAMGPGSYSRGLLSLDGTNETSEPAPAVDDKDLESQKAREGEQGDIDDEKVDDDKSASEILTGNGNAPRGHKGKGRCGCTWCNSQWSQEDLLVSMFGKDKGQTRVQLPIQDDRRTGWLWWENER